MTSPTFAEVTQQWYRYYDGTVATKTSRQTHRAINEYVLPVIGSIPIDKLKPIQILDLHKQIATRSTYYGRRLVADVIRITDYAVIILQLLDYNYLARIQSYLIDHKVIGRQYVALSDVPAMLQAIDSSATSAKQIQLALWTLIYTGLRRSEVALARKSEFDFDARRWIIPAERMKVRGNGQHIVPLSEQVVAMLEPYFASTDSEWAYPSPTKYNQPINPWALYYPLKQAGYIGQQTLHGYRKIFSTHAHQSRRWTIDAIELSLAHRISGVRGVYNHAHMLEERTELMQWYANELDKWRGVV